MIGNINISTIQEFDKLTNLFLQKKISNSFIVGLEH